MKKHKRFGRILALILVFAMAFQFATTASAASVTWEANDGYTYIATVNKGNASAAKTVNVPGSKVYHTYGSVQYITSGTWTVTANATTNFPSTYKTKLNEAATKAGVALTYSKSVRLTGSVVIPAAYPQGYYCARTQVTGVSANWYVQKSGVSGYVSSGTLSFTPVACTGAITGLYALDVEGT